MKRYFYSFLVVLIFTISCKTNVRSDNQKNSIIEKFYKVYNSQDVDQIAEISDNSISDMLKNTASYNYNYLGENISHTQYSKKDIIRGNVKQLVFTFESKYKKSDEPIFEKFFINTKTNKISSYVYSGNKEFIDNYETYSKKASDATFNYYNKLIIDDMSVLDELLDKELIVDKDLKDKFVEVLRDRRKAYGKIVSYSQLNINTFLKNENVIIVQRFECLTDKNEHVFEELQLIERNGEFKIFDYYYAPDYNTLIGEQ